jgi:hypothetical protein
MGMNTFQTDDDTYVPLSCYQSTFFEQKKRNLIKKQEYEERKRVQRMEHDLQFKKQLQLERVLVDKEAQSSTSADPSINSTITISPETLQNSTSPEISNDTLAISSEVSTSSTSPISTEVPTKTETVQKKSFYDSITDASTASCSKTCDISKMM